MQIKCFVLSVQRRQASTAHSSTSTPAVDQPLKESISGRRSTVGCASAGVSRLISVTWAARPTCVTWSRPAVAVDRAARLLSLTSNCARAVRVRPMSRGTCRCPTHAWQVSLTPNVTTAVFRKKHPLTFSSISRTELKLRICRYITMYPRNGAS